jgi:chromosomal replication initiator protein
MCVCGTFSKLSTVMHMFIHTFRSTDMLEKILEKWDEILLNIKDEHDITDVSYKTWLLPLRPYSVDKDILTILVPDDLFLNYVKKKYEFLLKFTIEEITGIQCEIRFLSKDNIKEETSERKLIKNNTTSVSQLAIQNANLNPRYTFESFVVGKNNNLAHAASLAVAESPGEIYNPLFIYGGVGLGKTHLMHSVAHFILKNNSNAKILYVTSEKFTNELIDAIRNKNNFSTTEFREKYRNNDVLLIDDIQFIIGKAHRRNFSIPLMLCTKQKNKLLSPLTVLQEKLKHWKTVSVPGLSGGSR